MAEAAVDCIVDQDVLDCAAAMAMEKLRNAITPKKDSAMSGKKATARGTAGGFMSAAAEFHSAQHPTALEFHSAQHGGHGGEGDGVQ